jgi:hypothetical protein
MIICAGRAGDMEVKHTGFHSKNMKKLIGKPRRNDNIKIDLNQFQPFQLRQDTYEDTI